MQKDLQSESVIHVPGFMVVVVIVVVIVVVSVLFTLIHPAKRINTIVDIKIIFAILFIIINLYAFILN